MDVPGDLQIGQKVWDRSRAKVHKETEQEQPNGYIVNIRWDDEEIDVKFHDADGTEVAYNFDEFESTWTDNYGGVWMLNDEE